MKAEEVEAEEAEQKNQNSSYHWNRPQLKLAILFKGLPYFMR
jgi:hypothetical protein